MEFSHRQLRHHASLSIRSIEITLSRILQYSTGHLKSRPASSFDATLTIVKTARQELHNVDHCLSLLEMTQHVIGYFVSLRGQADSAKVITEEISASFEESHLRQTQSRLEAMHTKLKVCVFIIVVYWDKVSMVHGYVALPRLQGF